MTSTLFFNARANNNKGAWQLVVKDGCHVETFTERSSPALFEQDRDKAEAWARTMVAA